jgi:hypothetical protein
MQGRRRHKIFSKQEAEYRQIRLKKYPERGNAGKRKWREANREKIKVTQREWNRKGGKHYEKSQLYNLSGLQGARAKIRGKHGQKWRPYKRIIAPNSEIHHCWLDNSSDYSCVALVEKDKHRHGIIDMIQILEGEITLFREGER